MSETEKVEIQYDEGEETVVLEDGQTAKRGEPVSVAPDLAERLLEQDFELVNAPVSARAPSQASSSTPAKTPASAPQKQED